MTTKLVLASVLPGEQAQLADVIADISDQSRKRRYADWLVQQGDPRGQFLNEVLDQWDTGTGDLPKNKSYSQVWQRTCGITLLQTMRSGPLDSITTLFRYVRPALMVNPTVAEAELPVGVSKFGGLPDLPAGTPWPDFKGELHTFVGQINLAEIAATQVSRELPTAGLLSFFVFDDSANSGLVAVDWKMIFTPETSTVQRRQPDKPFGECNRLVPECALEFEETLDLPYASLYDLDSNYADQFLGCRRAKQIGLIKTHDDAYEEAREVLMPNREERSHLLGWSHPNVSADDPVSEGFRNLLTVASERACEMCWSDGHQLYYSIPEDDLPQHRFDRIAVNDG